MTIIIIVVTVLAVLHIFALRVAVGHDVSVDHNESITKVLIDDSMGVRVTVPGANSTILSESFQLFQVMQTSSSNSTRISLSVLSGTGMSRLQMLGKYGSFPTFYDYDSKAHTSSAMTKTALVMNPSCSRNVASNGNSDLYVRVLNSNAYSIDVILHAETAISSIQLYKSNSPDIHASDHENGTSINGSLCCGSSDVYRLDISRTASSPFDVALLMVRLQNPTGLDSVNLQLVARRSTCATSVQYDTLISIATGDFGELFLEDDPRKGKWYVTVSAPGILSDKLYNLTAAVLSASQTASGLYTDNLFYNSLMAFRHRDDDENVDAKILGASVWVWIPLAVILGIVLGGTISISIWSSSSQQSRATRNAEEGFVNLQLPPAPQRFGSKGASSEASTPSKSILGIGSSSRPRNLDIDSKKKMNEEITIEMSTDNGGADSPGSVTKPKVAFLNDGIMKSSSSEMLQQTDGDDEMGNHVAIERSITIIDNYHRPRSMKFENNENEVDRGIEYFDSPRDLVYSAELSGPSGQLSLVHGSNEIGRGIAGVTCKKVSRKQLKLMFNAESGAVTMQTIGKNPSAIRKSVTEVSEEGTDGWKVLTNNDGKAKIGDSDEIALALPSRVPDELVIFTVLINKL